MASMGGGKKNVGIEMNAVAHGDTGAQRWWSGGNRAEAGQRDAGEKKTQPAERRRDA